MRQEQTLSGKVYFAGSEERRKCWERLVSSSRRRDPCFESTVLLEGAA